MYYVSEVQGLGVFGVAEPLKSTNLSAAKREASRYHKIFYGTVLYISYKTEDDSFGRSYIRPSDAIAFKYKGSWYDCESREWDSYDE